MAALKKCLGVDLGSNTIKLVEATLDKDAVKVTSVVSAETNIDPSAPLEDRRKAMIATVKELLKKSKTTTKNAVFALPGQRVFIRRFRLPETTPERLERIVRYEARQQIPFPIDKTDLQFQFFPIPEEAEVEVLLVAVRHDDVSDYMKLIDKCGLKPRMIGVSSFALFNTHALVDEDKEKVGEKILEAQGKKRKEEKPKKPKKKKKSKKGKKGEEEAPDEEEISAEEEAPEEDEFVFEEVHGYVNLGASTFDLTIASKGKDSSIKFSRSVPTAGNELTRAIMDACNIGSFLDAERIKKHQTQLVTYDFDPDSAGDVNPEACEAASHATDRIVAEIRRSLDFFISQPDGMAVDNIVLSGGQAKIEGVQDYLEEKLTIPVSRLEGTGEGTALQWPEPNEELTQFAPALGLALQGVGMGAVDVDFLPEERKIIRDFPYRTTAVLVVFLVGILFLTSQAGKQYAEKYRASASSLQVAINQQQGLIQDAQAIQDRHNKVAEKYDRLAAGFMDRDYWLQFMADLAEIKPPGVLIQSIEGNYEGEVTIIGITEANRTAAEFSTRLRELLEEPDQEPSLENLERIDARNIPGLEAPEAFRFWITLDTSDKKNLLQITPTPTPTPQGGPGGGFGGQFGGQGGQFGGNQFGGNPYF